MRPPLRDVTAIDDEDAILLPQRLLPQHLMLRQQCRVVPAALANALLQPAHPQLRTFASAEQPPGHGSG